MTGDRYCANCGGRIAPEARFCSTCGAEQPDPEPAAEPPGAAEPPPGTTEPPAEPAPGRQAPTAAHRPDRADGDAGALAGELAGMLRAPGLVAAAAAGAIAAALVFAAGLLIAVLLPDSSLIGAVGRDASIATEAFRQVIQVIGAEVYAPVALGLESQRLAPAVLLLIPVGASAIGAATQVSRTAGSPRGTRLAWGAATGVVFALLMLFCAIAAGGEGEIEPSLGGAFGLGLLWGAAGGIAGTRLALGPPDMPTDRSAAGWPAPLAAAGRGLLALGVLLAAMALVGSLIWVYATIVGTDNTQGDRSASVAVVENGLYTVEHGLHLIQLGGLGEFEDATVFDPLGLPAPASDPGEISTDGGSFQIFDYRDAIPAYAFIPLLIFVLVAPALMALYAGFSIARSVSASVLSTGAIWGLSVGPLWAIALALLNELIDKPVFGLPDADSVFAGVFLGGALFGAIGGLLAVRSRPPAAVR